MQSPYVAQVQLLRDRIDEIPEAVGVEVATIDSFQGREADAVIISMVCFFSHLFYHINTSKLGWHWVGFGSDFRFPVPISIYYFYPHSHIHRRVGL